MSVLLDTTSVSSESSSSSSSVESSYSSSSTTASSPPPPVKTIYQSNKCTLPWLSECGLYNIADPIPPMNEYDVRPSVKSLLDQYSNSISTIRNKLLKVKKNSNDITSSASSSSSNLFDPIQKHDDLFILRFLLSHKGNIPKAINAIQQTLQFRHQYQLDDTDVRNHLYDHNHNKHMDNESVQQYMKYIDDDAIRMVLPYNDKGSLITFIHFQGIHQHELISNVNEKHWLPTFLYFNEMIYQYMDIITRQTGRLTKSIRIIDLNHTLSLSSMNLELLRRDSQILSQTQYCYPQLIDGMFICNVPQCIQMVWNYLIKPIFPSRIVSKFHIITPQSNVSHRTLLYKYMDDKHLPSCYGGTGGAMGDKKENQPLQEVNA